jgi:hypothetical protein
LAFDVDFNEIVGVMAESARDHMAASRLDLGTRRDAKNCGATFDGEFIDTEIDAAAVIG